MAPPHRALCLLAVAITALAAIAAPCDPEAAAATAGPGACAPGALAVDPRIEPAAATGGGGGGGGRGGGPPGSITRPSDPGRLQALLDREASVVRISELMAAGGGGIRDEDGSWEDWVELASQEGADISGWSLVRQGHGRADSWTVRRAP